MKLARCVVVGICLVLFAGIGRTDQADSTAKSKAASELGDGGPAIKASLSYPCGVVVDSKGDIYVADTNANRVRKVDAKTGIITTIAGNSDRSSIGQDGVQATTCSLTHPYGLALDQAGNLLVAESGHGRIRKIDLKTGIITTLAGGGDLRLQLGQELPATKAYIGTSSAVAVDPKGDIIISDRNGYIRKMDVKAGTIKTIAGLGPRGYSGDGGSAIEAKLAEPIGVATDTKGNIYIADSGNLVIRKVEIATGIITTAVGKNKPDGSYPEAGPANEYQLTEPTGIAFDSKGNLHIACMWTHRICRFDAQTDIVTTVAGDGFRDGGGDGRFYGDGGPATAASLFNPIGIAFDSADNLYIADQTNHRIRRVDAKTGIITTIAGNGTPISAN